MKRKGISPLIASVLLIAFTMAIAGIMATWATTFSKGKLDTATSSSGCIGAIDINSLSFSNGTVTAKVRNLGDVNLTGLTASLEYEDAAKSKEFNKIIMSNYNFSDPLAPGDSDFFIYKTGDPTKPQKFDVVAANCKEFAVSLYFR